ncbi:hypothetical protein F3Y22_tig00111338pilonHSYRG00280 [Hibiscus syriacus]|uniref:Uncharacterized protein n=1 Tax=Hibiscus syriacus TaxID=106335 RepID=A0A6A2YPE6_HIBSY|nr:hypothetical protein F3Y22_tig00111338pilonHSYRG00280 [Hibiscus syriacus]
MGSKGRIAPPHPRRPLPGPGLVHPDPFGPGILPQPGPFPPFGLLPPLKIIEQKIAEQHIGPITSERENQMRSLAHKIAKMEAELKASEPVKRAHVDVQQIPAMMAELESLRQKYHHCREVEKLRAELVNTANIGSRTDGACIWQANAVGHCSGATGNNENGAGEGAAVYVGAQSGHTPTRTGYEMSRAATYDIATGTGYDVSRGAGYESHRATIYDVQRGSIYDGQRGANDASRNATYDAPARSFAPPHG